jgi:hypothetical protein
MDTINNLLIDFDKLIKEKEKLQSEHRLAINNTHAEGYQYLKDNGFIATAPVCCDYTQIRIDRLKYIKKIISAAYVTAEICDEHQDKIIEILKSITLNSSFIKFGEDFGICTYTLAIELKTLVDEYYRHKNIGYILKPYPDPDI